MSKDPAFKKLEKLKERREELDRCRRHALLAIFDEVHYPYPYDRGSQAYREVQTEIDRRVAAVREIWDDPTKVKIARKGNLARHLDDWDEAIAALKKADADVGDLVARMEAFSLFVTDQPVGDPGVREEPRRAEAPRLQPLGDDHLQPGADRGGHGGRAAADRGHQRVPRHDGLRGGGHPRAGLLRGHRRRERGEDPGRGPDRAARPPAGGAGRRPAGPRRPRPQPGHAAPGVLQPLRPPNPATGAAQTSPFDRMQKAGYEGGGGSENIANGAASPEDAHAMWCHSSGHHRNILSPWHDQGVGQAGRLWTQNYGIGGGAAPTIGGVPAPAEGEGSFLPGTTEGAGGPEAPAAPAPPPTGSPGSPLRPAAPRAAGSQGLAVPRTRADDGRPKRTARRAPVAKLYIVEEGKTSVYEIFESEVTLGRGAANRVQLRDLRAGKRHAVIRRLAGRWKLIDLESKNGTRVNGSFHNQHWLAQGDTITVGQAVLRVDLEGEGADLPPPPVPASLPVVVAAPPPPPRPAAVPAPRPAAAAPAAAPRPGALPRPGAAPARAGPARPAARPPAHGASRPGGARRGPEVEEGEEEEPHHVYKKQGMSGTTIALLSLAGAAVLAFVIFLLPSFGLSHNKKVWLAATKIADKNQWQDAVTYAKSNWDPDGPDFDRMKGDVDKWEEILRLNVLRARDEEARKWLNDNVGKYTRTPTYPLKNPLPDPELAKRLRQFLTEWGGDAPRAGDPLREAGRALGDLPAHPQERVREDHRRRAAVHRGETPGGRRGPGPPVRRGAEGL